MDDYLEQTVSKHGGDATSILYYAAWLIVAVFAVIALFALSNVVGLDPQTGRMAFSPVSLVLALAAGGVAYLGYRKKDNLRVEYDYVFTNGTLDISSVLNNKRRRYLCELEMKDVIRCGPAAGPAFDRSLKEPNVRRHNWFVNRGAKLYHFYFQKNGVKHLAVMELNDEMIRMIRSKQYLQIGTWYDADGRQTYGSSLS
ncbi:MAG: hypothetical protein IJJ45_03175 [Clostridia bacterium]|nr:hypothetical protein [Clostridia bacterium]